MVKFIKCCIFGFSIGLLLFAYGVYRAIQQEITCQQIADRIWEETEK